MSLAAVAALSVALLSGCGSSGGDTNESESDLSRSRFTLLESATNKNLDALLKASPKMIGFYSYSVYRFNRVTDEATNDLSRENRVKETMHRYSCRFFDEEIAVGRDGKPEQEVKAIADLFEYDQWDMDKADLKAYEDALAKVAADPDLDILSGSASGNNTSGTVLGVYDVKNNEILETTSTNCGSDD